jgi:hypothetical protein
MPPDLKELELPVLYDLLAVYTTQYTHIMRWGDPSDNLKVCKDSILALQTEIDFRKTQADTGVEQYKDLNDGLELATPLV